MLEVGEARPVRGVAEGELAARPRVPEAGRAEHRTGTPSGHIPVDEVGATSVAGVWAVGDLTSPMASVARAIAAGSAAAAAITHDLVAAS